MLSIVIATAIALQVGAPPTAASSTPIGVASPVYLPRGGPVPSITEPGSGETASRRLDELPRRRVDLSACYRATALRLGASNTETADTLIRAARSICEPQRAAIADILPIEYLGRSLVARRLAVFQEEAENAAIAALLKARVARHP